MELVEHIYTITREFPRTEVYGLASQMQRAAVSIPSNIAEGHIRSYTREYLHHISIAHGSVAELQTQVEIAIRLGYVNADSGELLLESASSLSRQLHSLRSSLSDRLAKSQPPTPNPHV